MEQKDFPAFPVKPYPEMQHDFENSFGAYGGINPTGVTKREYFALNILNGLLANSGHSAQIHNIQQAVSIAVNYADELGNKLTNKEISKERLIKDLINDELLEDWVMVGYQQDNINLDRMKIAKYVRDRIAEKISTKIS